MSDVDSFADDPFFRKGKDWIWNACIGQQGGEENYLDGYIESALELANTIIEKQLYGQRDTLVLPILYNARHGLELALKFVTDRLVYTKMIKNDGFKRNHNIKVHWERLYDSDVGDEKIRDVLDALRPFVDSLSRIDSDGQELRYHRNRENDRSLAKYNLVNLRTVQSSLSILKNLIEDLKNRSISIVMERRVDSNTRRCSRADLLTIARIIRPREEWSTEVFNKSKIMVKERYNLGSRQFSKALDLIQKNREMRAIIGMESDFLHLDDDEVIQVTRHWRRLHPPREELDTTLYFPSPNSFSYASMRDRTTLFGDVVNAIRSELSDNALAEVQTLFYLGRDGFFAEYYEESVRRTCADHKAAGEPHRSIAHLMEKTNFLECLKLATPKVGRLTLRERLDGL